MTTNETQAIHVALSKFATEVLPAYEADDGPLTAEQIKLLRDQAAKQCPEGKLVSRKHLFA
jgi:hypothetical protein